MFSIFKHQGKKGLLDLSSIGVDIHSHLIPGIDDGAQTMEDSLNLIRQLQELGLHRIITTPHTNSAYYPNTPEIINAGLQEVRTALKNADIAIDFSAASEYFMDEHFEHLLDAKSPMLCIQDNFILVEIGFFGPPPKLEEYIFKLKIQGYRPVLAHPERYGYMGTKMEPYERLKDMGCYFQVNLLSLSGYYGKNVLDLAQKLIKNGLVELLGSDLHNQRHLDSIRQALPKKQFARALLDHEYKNKAFFGS